MLIIVAESRKSRSSFLRHLANTVKGMHARARSARRRGRKTISALHSGGSGSAKAGRRVWRRQTRAHVPLDWAKAQNNLGTALSALGEQEDGTARLEVAVAAYRAALEERTQERVPLDWAATQNNLGASHGALGSLV